MNRLTKIKITELNPHVICVLCGGYYINATTIVECLHSFCRTCITRYLETSKYCPVCDVMVHKTRPLEYIRSDKTLQDLVYKLVPGLYKSEMKRRREYYALHDNSGVPQPPSEDRGTEFHDRIIYTEDEKISLSLELCAEGIPFKTPSSIHGHDGPENIKISDVRYLSCPAAFSVGNLKKFIRMKFDLKLKYEIDVFHTAEPLPDYYTLMDIAYIYTWTRRAPLRLYYTVYECKIPRKIPELICVQKDKTVDSPEKIIVVEQKVLNGQEKPKRKRKIYRKRKLPDGPDDVVPDFEAETTVQAKPNANERRKDTVGRKKQKRMLVASVDNSVMEAMSESEEQLAKLTLNCSNEFGAITVDTGGDSSSQSDLNELVNKHDEGGIQTADKDFSNMFQDDNSEKTVVYSNADAKSTPQISPGSISISMFQPLNDAESENVTLKTNRETVFDFQENGDTGKGTKPKGRGGPGRKKKSEVGEKKAGRVKANDKQTGSLVISGKHPDMGQLPEKKKRGRKKKSETMTNSVGENENKSNTKSTAKVSNETGERVKRKYVRKAIKTEQSGNTTQTSKKGRKPKQEETKGEPKISKADKKDEGVDKISNIKKTKQNDSEDSVNGGPKCKENKLDCVSDKGSNECNSKVSQPDEDKAKVGDNLEICQVASPSTPLYGQTPKVTESNQGLPVSPNPECAANSVLDVNEGYGKLFNTINEPCSKDVDESINNDGSPKCVNENTVCPAVVNDATEVDYSSNMALRNDDMDAKLVIDERSGVENGYHNNGVDMINEHYRKGDTVPLLRPSQDALTMDEFRPNSPGPKTDTFGSIYAQMDQTSDQPLDLTSNGRREEYMKGKIFKTKMLKRAFPKPDLGLSQKDKLGSPANNGIHHQSWT